MRTKIQQNLKFLIDKPIGVRPRPCPRKKLPAEDLIKVEKILIEPKYFLAGLAESPEIFTSQRVYRVLTYLEKEFLKPAGLRFLIFDGYRSTAVQRKVYKKFFEEIKKRHPDWHENKIICETEKFAAKPDDKAIHFSGRAIDLTLATSQKEEIPMGGEFDQLEDVSRSDFFERNNLTSVEMAYRNYRRILFNAMTWRDGQIIKILGQSKIIGDDVEWWHYTLID